MVLTLQILGGPIILPGGAFAEHFLTVHGTKRTLYTERWNNLIAQPKHYYQTIEFKTIRLTGVTSKTQPN